MNKILPIFLLLIVGEAHAATAKTVPESLGEEHAAVLKAAEDERAQIAPIRTKEKLELAAIEADKTKSADEKRTAAHKVRKKYLAQRNAIRLRIRSAHQATLAHN